MNSSCCQAPSSVLCILSQLKDITSGFFFFHFVFRIINFSSLLFPLSKHKHTMLVFFLKYSYLNPLLSWSNISILYISLESFNIFLPFNHYPLQYIYICHYHSTETTLVKVTSDPYIVESTSCLITQQPLTCSTYHYLEPF